MTGARAQQGSRAVGRRRQQLLEGVGSRDCLGERGQRLQLDDPRPGALVQPRVLDRAGDECRGRHQKVDLLTRELARRLAVGGDDADDHTLLVEERYRHERLEALLLELGEDLDARIGEQALDHDCRSAMLHRPTGETLSLLHRDLADEVLERGRCGSQHQPLVRLLDEVDEARVNGARLGEQAHDRAKHLVELERRRNGRDDLGEEVSLGANAHGDERTEAARP